MRKLILIMITALMLVIILAACGDKTDDSAATLPTDAEGYYIVPTDADGGYVLPTDTNGDAFIPTDSAGDAILGTESNGRVYVIKPSAKTSGGESGSTGNNGSGNNGSGGSGSDPTTAAGSGDVIEDDIPVIVVTIPDDEDMYELPIL